MEGFLNVDSVVLSGVDAVVDLNEFPWPFASNEWEKVIAYHVFEHLVDLVKAIEELYRILVPGGVADVRVPHLAGWGMWNDPTHRHFFTRRSFEYFGRSHPFNYYFNVGFTQVDTRNFFGIGASRHLNWIMNPILNTVLYDYYLWKIIPCAEVRIRMVK